MIRKIFLAAALLVAPACSNRLELADEKSIYKAVLIHADTAIKYQRPAFVFPEVFPMDMDSPGITLWWGNDAGAHEPAHDAVRRALAQIPSLGVCDIQEGISGCVIRSGETGLYLSEIDIEQGFPRVAVAVFEKSERSFGARTYLAHLSKASGEWKVEAMEWDSYIN